MAIVSTHACQKIEFDCHLWMASQQQLTVVMLNIRQSSKHQPGQRNYTVFKMPSVTKGLYIPMSACNNINHKCIGITVINLSSNVSWSLFSNYFIQNFKLFFIMGRHCYVCNCHSVAQERHGKLSIHSLLYNKITQIQDSTLEPSQNCCSTKKKNICHSNVPALWSHNILYFIVLHVGASSKRASLALMKSALLGQAHYLVEEDRPYIEVRSASSEDYR